MFYNRNQDNEGTTMILMAREAWINSQLSIARFYGGITVRGVEYHIVPPCNDLVDVDFIKYFQTLGRKKFIEVLEEHPHAGRSAMHVHFGALMPKKAEKKKRVEHVELSLF